MRGSAGEPLIPLFKSKGATIRDRVGRRRDARPEFANHDDQLRAVLAYAEKQFRIYGGRRAHATPDKYPHHHNSVEKAGSYLAVLASTAYRAWKLGYYSSEIAAELGTTTAVIDHHITRMIRYARALGFETYRRRRSLAPIVVEQIVGYWNDGDTLKEIQKQIAQPASIQQIKQILQDRKLYKKRRGLGIRWKHRNPKAKASAEDIVRLWNKGLSLAQVARELNSPPESIRRFLLDLGVYADRGHPCEAKSKQIIGLYKRGKTTVQIASELGLNASGVLQLLNRRGVYVAHRDRKNKLRSKWPISKTKRLIRLYHSGKTWKEVAAAFGIPYGQATYRYYRAHNLRRKMKLGHRHLPRIWNTDRLNELVTLVYVDRKTLRQCANEMGVGFFGLVSAFHSAKCRKLIKKRGFRIRKKNGRLRLTGKKFGRLRVIRFAGLNKLHHTMWLCRCSCGVKKVYDGNPLVTGKIVGCGGHKPRGKKSVHYKNGNYTKKMVRTHRTYRAVLWRCYDPTYTNWEHYGGRGIKVAPRWLGPEGFKNFVADMGRRPQGKSLDRIDPNKNYEPSNCRWATSKQQANNKRRHHPPPTPEQVAALMKACEPTYEENPF